MAQPHLEGDPARIAELLAVEQLLEIVLPTAFRHFIANRERYSVPVKQVSFWAISRCTWLDDSESAVTVGESDGAPVCFRVSRGRTASSEALWASEPEGFKRLPDFSELVRFERLPTAKSHEAAVVFAERIAGLRKACPRDGTELIIGETCKACGHIGEPKDVKYVMAPEVLETERAAHPTLWRAWQIVSTLKQAGHGVPTGSVQVLALGALLGQSLEPVAVARAMLERWKEKGLRVTVSEADVTQAVVSTQ